LLLTALSASDVSGEWVEDVSVLVYQGPPHVSSTGYVSIRFGGVEFPVLFDVVHQIASGTSGSSVVASNYAYVAGHYWEAIQGPVSENTCYFASIHAWVTGTSAETTDYSGIDCYQLVIPPTCPIVIDLRGDGFHFSGLDDSVFFDIDADGELDETGWTAADARDGLLVLDRDRNGAIDSGGELFGNATRLSSGEYAPNGYVALADFDRSVNGGHQDGRIDRSDRVFGRLRIWVDGNHDGISEPSELKPLGEYQIESISLTYLQQPVADEYGNVAVFFGSVSLFGDRTTLSTDVFFVGADD
jgi:hypothetical protein